MAHVQNYEGIEITLTEEGQFVARVNGKLEKAASLSSLKAKIKASHVGDIKGRVEGLCTPPSGQLDFGYREPQPLVILGISSEKSGRGNYAQVRQVYVIENTSGSSYERWNKGSTITLEAKRLVRPNPEAMAKLNALRADFQRIKEDMEKQGAAILRDEFEYVEPEEVKKLLDGRA